MLCYIHIPFCASKCGYCGFNSLANMLNFKEKYIESLCVDLEGEIESWQMRVDSAKSQNLEGNQTKNAESTFPCHSEHSEEFQKNPFVILSEAKYLKNHQNRDSSPMAQNDKVGAQIAESRQSTKYSPSLAEGVRGWVDSTKFHSIYIGGGTPNTLNPKDFERIFKILSPKIAPNTEITMELNPNASPKETLSAFKDLGVNRFSIGVQSFCNDKLKLLERNHSPKIARKFIENALNCGVKISIDLIYDTILDSPKSLRFELENALNLGVGHISCYALSIDKNSAFYAKGKNPVRESSLCYDLEAILESRGFSQYEVSNFALNHKSAHNLGYWAYRDYIGVGLGAVGKITSANGVYRTYKNGDFGAYLANPSAFRCEYLSQSDIRLEKIFLGLRSEVGVESALIADKNRLDLLVKSGKVFAKQNRIFAKNYFIADEIALWVE